MTLDFVEERSHRPCLAVYGCGRLLNISIYCKEAIPASGVKWQSLKLAIAIEQVILWDLSLRPDNLENPKANGTFPSQLRLHFLRSLFIEVTN